MTEYLKTLLREQGVELFAPVPVSACRLTRPYKLTRAGFSSHAELTAFLLAVPYLTPQGERNLSAYAVPRDYHGFFRALFDAVLPALRERYPDALFAGFADDSPIDEREAAAMAGLGVIGENGMLITERYSSYVFLGEIVTDLPVEDAVARPIRHCEGCGACRRACPKDALGQCLSALTQKKGLLDEKEKEAIRRFGTVWGCDKCQEVCPHTLRALSEGTIYTTVDYFKTHLSPVLTTETLDRMTDEEFACRAYSWRGRPTIRRNLELFERSK